MIAGNLRAGRNVATLAAAVCTIKLTSGRLVPVLGRRTWHLAEDPRRQVDEIAALRIGLDLEMALIDTADSRGLRPDGAHERDPVSEGGSQVMAVMSIARFERFFRVAAGLDVDKSDLKRYSDFVNQKTYDLLIRSEAAAKANGRDIIEPFDLPVTKGLQERIHDFRRIDEEIDLKSILEYLAAQPPLDLAYSAETEGRLPEIVGGLSVALARSFKIIDSDLKNPRTLQWERAFNIFNLLL